MKALYICCIEAAANAPYVVLALLLAGRLLSTRQRQASLEQKETWPELLLTLITNTVLVAHQTIALAKGIK
jgi:hypothetical protein